MRCPGTRNTPPPSSAPTALRIGTICQGNDAVGKDHDARIGRRYFDAGRYKADKVRKLACPSCLVEHDAHHYEGLPDDRQPGVGAIDVRNPKVEAAEVVADRIRALRRLAPEQTVITSSCGLGHLPRQAAMGKLVAITKAERILGG